MNCCNCNCNQVPFVDGYVPYLQVTNITVGAASVNLSMGDRNIAPTGTMYVRIGTAIPTGTTETLPVTLQLNGNIRPLTFFGGQPVTVADIQGTGVLEVFNDLGNGILQLLSTPAPAAAATNQQG